jgi:hypothetical protein
MNNQPFIARDANLSLAWGKAFLHALSPNYGEPAMIQVDCPSKEAILEDSQIRDQLNALLRNYGIPTIEQTALTIAPYDRWERMGRPPLPDIKHWYLTQFLPRIQRRCSKNRRGTYFERMVRYTGVRRRASGCQIREVDQLEHVLYLWRRSSQQGKRPRQSALQLSIFDPAKDHTGSALLGFPCLQQVSLTYRAVGEFEMHAYYPTQYMFDRAYGNYLGLCQLGLMIGHFLNLRFAKFRCYVPTPDIGSSVTKSDLRELATLVETRIGASVT